MFVPGKPLHPSIMFVGKVGAYPSEAALRGLPGIKTQAYYGY